MSIKILVIQNSPTAPLGVLEECLQERQVEFGLWNPASGQLPISTAYAGLIVLGGPMSAEDDAGYPHLMDVVRSIQSFAAEHKPILGICLGAQLIARAFGKRVYPHTTVELGFTPLRPIREAIASDPLLSSALPANCDWIQIMEWHFDTFDLPDEAKLLLTGDRCQNQAYRIADNIYGFQCHFEVDRSILMGWLANGRDYVARNHPDFPARLAKQADLYLEDSKRFCRKLCNAWLDLIPVEVVSNSA